MLVSTNGVIFTASFEGFASKAYRCPAGVITIGFGFTMASKVFAAWWLARHGRALQMGDTIARADAEQVLAKLLNDEYGAAVDLKLGLLPVHQKDGATSMSFNCGTGALAWKWAQALKRRAVSEAATLLRSTAVTANGRQLAGLVRRRAAEATLIATGNYGSAIIPNIDPPSQSTAREDVIWYQTALKKLGYAVAVDGNPAQSDAQLRLFQSRNELLPDGKVGPATRATMIRLLDAKTAAKTSTVGGVATGGADAVSNAPTSTTPAPIDASGNAMDPALADAIGQAAFVGLGVALVIFVVWMAWRYRGKFTGRRVPT